MKCSECKWWGHYASISDDYRQCQNVKTYIRQFPLADTLDKSQIMAYGYHCSPFVGKEFGCIHFEPK